MLDNWPRAQSDDTYVLSDVQARVYRGSAPSITKLSPGQIVPNLTLKLKNLVNLNDNTSRVGSVELIRSSKWFTLVDSKVNENGELVFSVMAATTKTPDGRIVRIRVNYEFSVAAYQNADYCYQIV